VSPRKIAGSVRRDTPLLREDDTVHDALAKILEGELPALPVVDAGGKLRGIFGEREFVGALFPGYLEQIGHARFVPRSLDDALEKHAACLRDRVGDHMNTEHVEVGGDFSDTHVAEIFLHHGVLVIPIVEDGRVTGVITRRDYFRALAERMLARP
jgi:CBS domain-containing protein